MSKSEKLLDMYESQTNSTNENESQIVVESCCDALCDSCICCTGCAGGECC